MTSVWTVDYYKAKIRASELKPVGKTVFTDPSGEIWYVDDPAPMTPEEREESFNRLQALRDRNA
jgi:hypothetical protein